MMSPVNAGDTPPSHSPSLPRAFALCALAYVLALCVAVGVGYAVSDRHPIVVALVADVAATLVIYTFSRAFRNASFYDPYWSVAPLAIALYWTLGTASESTVTARQVVVLALVFLWALRLTFNWARQWRGLKHEDWRYADFRKRSKGWFWLVDLFGIEMMPTMVVFLGCLSLYPALSVGQNSFGLLDGIAIAITAAAIVIEATADEQLLRFVRKKQQPGQIMAKGLWAYSRHPNYFGEITFWWGLYVFGLAADSGYWWTVAGPLVITAMFLFVSIPMMEKRNIERRPDYGEHKKKVSILIPWFPRN
jgi:steroid 5-alpha reductase family enzyme